MNKLLKEKVINSKGFFGFSLLLCLVLFFFTTINHNLSYRIISIDYYSQNEFSKSLIDGHGISKSLIDESDLSQKKYLKESLWPPGYIVVNAIFSKLTNLDFNKSYIVQKTFSDLFLLSIFLYIFYKNRSYFNRWAVPIFIFFLSFSGFYFKKVGLLDNISLGLFLLSLQLLFTVKLKLLNLLFFGVLCFAPAIFRPAYYCLIFVAPFLCVVRGVLNENRFEKRNLVPFITTFILLACQLGFMKFYFTSNINPIETLAYKDSRFFIENLATFDAIFLNAFIYDNDLLRLVNQFLPFIKLDEFFIKLFLSSVFFLTLIFPLILFLKYKIRNQLLNNIMILLFISSLVSVLFLSALSFYYPPFPVSGENINRTWVLFTRYHILTEFTLLLFAFYVVFEKRKFFKKRVKMTFVLMLTASLGTNSFYWLYHEVKTMSYSPTGVVKDAEMVKKKLNSTTGKVIYLPTKIDAQENEFKENAFKCELLNSIYGLIPLATIDEPFTSERINCIITLPKSNKHPLHKKVSEIIKNNQSEKILYSEGLKKDIYLVKLLPKNQADQKNNN